MQRPPRGKLAGGTLWNLPGKREWVDSFTGMFQNEKRQTVSTTSRVKRTLRSISYEAIFYKPKGTRACPTIWWCHWSGQRRWLHLMPKRTRSSRKKRHKLHDRAKVHFQTLQLACQVWTKTTSPACEDDIENCVQASLGSGFEDIKICRDMSTSFGTSWLAGISRQL